jgi:hypothetical protein
MATRQHAALRPPVMAPQAALATRRYQAPSRAGKRGITFYLPPDQWRHLRRLAVDTDATMQDLMEEAIALLFTRHGVQRRPA